jgi:hypothetical protein
LGDVSVRGGAHPSIEGDLEDRNRCFGGEFGGRFGDAPATQPFCHRRRQRCQLDQLALLQTRVGGDDGLAPSGVFATTVEHLSDGLQRTAHRVEWRCGVRSVSNVLRHQLHERVLPPEQHLPFIGVVPEERSLRQARPLGDLRDRRPVEPALGVELKGRLLQAAARVRLPPMRVGTSVVPINPRRPLIVAAAAQTAQAATHGRFSLGLGLGVPFLEESVFGITTSNTVQRLREYLMVLRAIRDERTVDFHGSQITAVDPSVLPVALAGATPFPLYVAAMGPRAAAHRRVGRRKR